MIPPRHALAPGRLRPRSGWLLEPACGTPEGQESPLFHAGRDPHPDPEPVLGFLDARRRVSLAGAWPAIVDPLGVGRSGSPFGGFAQGRRNHTGLELVEYDFEASEPLRVPGDWNSQRERLFFYCGAVWYQRRFDRPEGWGGDGRRVLVHFGGANYTTEVFLNGAPVGRHVGGYVPFACDVTDALTHEDNVLLVHVDNTLDDASVPTRRIDWWPYGGLIRDVHLVEVPRAGVANARVWLADRETREIRAEVATTGLAAGSPVRLALPGLGIEEQAASDADDRARFAFRAPDCALWSPAQPVLHDVEIAAGDDAVGDRIGFRSIEARGTRLFLNGEPLRLRGISTHEEPIGRPGVAFSDADTRRLLEEARALGANFVRAAHYPHSRHLARAADELGVLLWEEIPVYWDIAWDDPVALASARNQARRLVERDWNRASVVIWAVANETPISDARMHFLGTLIDDVRALDDSRLVSAALLGDVVDKLKRLLPHIAVRGLARPGVAPEVRAAFEAVIERSGEPAPPTDAVVTLPVRDPLSERIDVVAYNQYLGWYYSIFFAKAIGVNEAAVRPIMLELLPDLRLAADVDKPIHVSEFGAGALQGRRSEANHLWSEDYQAAVYRGQLAMLSASPQVAGISPWILKDFRAMLRTLAGVQDYYNRKGLIDPDGKHKLAFEVLREFYAGDWSRGG